MARTAALIYIIATLATRCLHAGGFDAPLPDVERAKLDQLATHALAMADKSYTDQKFQQATAEYEAFIKLYAKSPAIPYAMFQKARCLHLGGDPGEAIQAYDTLIDVFPTLLPYAVPALYFMAEGHVQNQDIPNAIKTWTEMVSDKDYRRHPLAAVVINKLAPNLRALNKTEEAMKMYRQGAVDFRSGNPEQALQSMNALLEYYIVTAPNEPELRKLFKDAGGFERTAMTVDPKEDVAQNRLYWQQVWGRVVAGANTFTTVQIDSKRKLLAYWAEAFKGRFPDWKEYQEQLAAFTLPVL